VLAISQGASFKQGGILQDGKLGAVKKMRLVIKKHTSAIAPTFAPHKFLLTQRPYASNIFYIMCFVARPDLNEGALQGVLKITLYSLNFLAVTSCNGQCCLPIVPALLKPTTHRSIILCCLLYVELFSLPC